MVFAVIEERTILGVPISVYLRADAVARLDEAISTEQQLKVAFANAHALNIAATSPDVRKALRDFCILNDGFGVDIASRIKFGRSFPENLNGTDFIPSYLGATCHSIRLFLLGGKPGVAAAAADVLARRFPRHCVVGHHHGYFPDNQSDEVCELIKAARPDAVLVAMGVPLQELWIARHAPKTGGAVLIGVGALFDFLTGRARRAPEWVRTARCEWICRLIQEPRRLWKRYLIGNATFIKKVLFESTAGHTPPPPQNLHSP